ncbi:MAG TPA: class I SAM-dependent methyltransferase [Acidimicrobiia bacterium]|nr:class I SAM-dependent methyltransferase [Acidimicrobiia bacterium]
MEIANVDMAKLWDGEDGDDWTDDADRYDATSRYVWPLFTANVAVSPTDTLLDIGCGTGHSMRSYAPLVQHAVGIDLSRRMLECARERSAAAGHTNVEYLHADAQVHPFEPDTFGIAISSMGGMFFADPIAAYSNIRAALRPRGRLALLSWQPFVANEWLRTFFDALACGRDLAPPPAGVPGPFGLAEPDGVRQMLGAAGFQDVDLMPLDAPVWLGATADDAWDFVSRMGIVRGLTGGLDDDTKRAALDRLRAAVAASETPDGVQLAAAEWLISAHT